MRQLLERLFFAAFISLCCLSAQAADRAQLNKFLEVTGFDVALESLKLSADSAPSMIGIDADAFGVQWETMVDDVFDTEEMQENALDMLAETLEQDVLEHAVAFYDSELGQRLVQAENASHMKDDAELKEESGEAIIAGLVRIGAPRLEELKRLNGAIDGADASVHAIQEVQVRFLMAAAVAGVIELQMEEQDLREALARQEGELRRSIQASALTNSAYTYQAFSDDEISDYADALEHPKMQRLYALMNAVQFQIMADRFEELALEMEALRPSQEL